jgi:hypothetical protein
MRRANCANCGKKAIPVNPTCLCDRDFCSGQRCGADLIVEYYKCQECGWTSERTEEGQQYIERYCK